MAQNLVGLELPFPSRISLLADRVEDGVRVWADDRQLVCSEAARHHLAQTGIGYLAARCFAGAELGRLALIGQWLTLIIRLDDQFDDGPLRRQPQQVDEVAGELEGILRAAPGQAPAPRSPVADALIDLWGRTAELMSPAWRRRFVRDFSRWLDSLRGEVATRAERGHPEESAHHVARRDAGGIQNVLDLIELAAHCEVPPSFEAGATYRHLRDLAADVVQWTNDLVSLEKELARDDVHNAVILARHHRGLSLDAAVDEVVVNLGAAVAAFVAAEDGLDAAMDAARLARDDRLRVHAAVDGMGLLMRGHLDWAAGNPRYGEVERVGYDGVPEHLDVILHVAHLPHHPPPEYAHLAAGDVTGGRA